MEIREKRVYDPPAASDGFRVLIDRLWPRGLSKDKARIDLWEKEIAPSSDLRRAFHHDGMSWGDFAVAYRAELAVNTAGIADLRAKLAGHDVVTFLYSTSTEHNHAALVREALGA